MEPRTPSERACERASELIDDLVDGVLGDADRTELDGHLAACPACRALARDLDDLHRVARELPSRSPRADAWDRIAERLDTDSRVPGHVVHRTWASTKVLLPLAAALVLAVAASLLYLSRPGGDNGQSGTQASVHASQDDLVRSVDQELRLAESHYENAIAGLEKIAGDNQGALTPEVAATLQKNLGIIDQAIQESRQALTDEPESTLARESLFEAFRKKVSLLEDTIALINVMSRGDQAGAARVIEGITKS